MGGGDVRPERAGPEGGNRRAAITGASGGPTHLFVETMIIAERPPGGASDLSVGHGTAEHRGAAEGGLAAILLQHGHLDCFKAFFGEGRRSPVGVALAELGLGEEVIAELESEREIAFQSAVERIGEYACRGQADIVEVLAEIDGATLGDDGIEAGQEWRLVEPTQHRQFFLFGQVFEQAVGHGAAQGDELIDVGRGARANFRKVDAGFDAFVANPIGVGAVDIIIGQGDLG